MPAFGVSKETVNANANVRVVNFGSVTNLDTSNYSEGDELFVSDIAGQLTGIAPTGEASALQKMAKVTRSDNSAGSITVMGAGRSNAVPNLNEGRLFVGNSSNEAVADGTIHVGENSIVLADETVSASGNDEIYSSSGKLQLGNNSNHVTEVKGSLRVQDPKVETDAANRRYVDGIGASALASISSLTAIPEGNGVGLGSGFINGQSALALGAQSVLENGMNINFSSAYNSTVGSYTVTTGVGFSF